MTATRNLSFQVRALTVACTDVDRSARFYSSVLGAKPIATDNATGWWYQLGSLQVNLLPNAAERSPARFPTDAMPMLWLEVDDIAAASEFLACNDVEVVEPSDGQQMMIADPDGLIIEVWQSSPKP